MSEPRTWVAIIEWHNSRWSLGGSLSEAEAWKVADLLLVALRADRPRETGRIVSVEPDWRSDTPVTP